MDLVSYIGLKIKLRLINDYYFIGKVIEADDISITIIDMNNKRVSLKKESILTIQEVSQNGR